jgi:hypothetical protein
MREKIKVLFLAADPFRPGERLRLDEEVRAIDQAIRRGSARDSVELVSQFATRTGDLQDALLRHDPQVVHFAGHGGARGAIYLGDEYGRPQTVGKEALAGLFGIRRDTVRVVLLNGCETLPTAELLSEVVDYAIGMSGRIHDDSAARFSAAFYGALAMGQTLADSFAYGVNRLELEGNLDAKLPVLCVRPGIDTHATLVARSSEDIGVPQQPNAFGPVKARRNTLFDNRQVGGDQTSEFPSFNGGGMTFRNSG